MPSNEEFSTVAGLSARLHTDAKGSTSARRSLFGPADHQENDNVLAELSDQLNQHAKSRWNFDFRSCVPLPGRYDWSPTDAMDDGQPTVAADDVSDRVNDAGSGIEAVHETANEHNSRMDICGKISPSFTSSLSSPNYEQTISCFMKSKSKKIIRRLTWAPKKKIGFLSRPSKRRAISDYFPARKQLKF